jgi:hypothetical protein
LDSLAAILARQAEILAALEAMIRELAQSSEIEQYRRELGELKRNQSALVRETEAIAREALQGDRDNVADEQNRRRDQALTKQRDLAARLANAISRMRQSAAALGAANLTDAARLDAVVAAAAERRIQAEVQAAADQLAADRFAQAAESQRGAAAQLQQLQDKLAERGEDASTQRLAALEQAERRLQELRRELKQPQPSQDIAERTGALAQRLEQLRADDAAKSVQQAAAELGKRENTEAANKQAQSNLEQAQQELAAELRRQQTLLSKQQIERLDAVLNHLVAAQQAIVEKALELSAPSDQAGAAKLALQQAAVRQQSRAQADQIEQFPVFARLLHSAADTMKQAEDRLSDGTAAAAAPLATRAHEQLQLLASAVRQQRQQQSQPPKPNQRQAPNPPGNPNEQKNDPDQVQTLQLAVAQLGLLRTMQADLQERTKELEDKHASGEVEGKALAEHSARLAEEQRELAGLAESLMRDATLPPNDADADAE